MTFVKFISNISSCLVPAVSRELRKSSLTLLIPVSCIIAIMLMVTGRQGGGPALPFAELWLLKGPGWSHTELLVPVDPSEAESNQPVISCPVKDPVAALVWMAGMQG